MEKMAVNSSMISSISYNAKKSILEIEFKESRSIWQYYDFPKKLWNEFKNCDSFGRYFNSYIKDEFNEVRVG